MSQDLNIITKNRVLGRIAEQLKDVIRAAAEKGFANVGLHNLELLPFGDLALHAEDAALYLAPFVQADESAIRLRYQRQVAANGYAHDGTKTFGEGFEMSSTTDYIETEGDWVCSVTANRGDEQRAGNLRIVFDASAATIQKVFLDDKRLA